jgi:predicted kinase
MPTLFIPIGIPGCGKSTWARKVIDNAVIVSSDGIRKELFASLVAANDPQVKQTANARVFTIFHERIAAALKLGLDVIADATNLTSDSRRKLRDIAADHGAVVHYVLFDNVVEAIHGNRQRDKDSTVPDHVMDGMVQKLIVTREVIHGEGFDSLTVLSSVHPR